MADPTRTALRNLERVLSRDPLLRDVLEQTVPKARRGGKFVPDVDVTEVDDAFTVRLDLPGLGRDDLSVELEGLRLVITGDRRPDHDGGSTLKTAERRFGAFRREFLLPANADGQQVSAKLADGVLTVRIPRVGRTRRRVVPVEGQVPEDV